jgi:tripartite-type tricarboxylate transporter receptor subunit TctC
MCCDPLKSCVYATRMAAALGVCLLAASGVAPAYPDRPIRLLLPSAPGGGVDAVARVITPKLHETLRQPWVIDNRGGAGGNVAAEIVARANPDGHTVLLAYSTVLTVNPLLYKLPIDVSRDLAPVAMVTAAQYIMVMHPSVKADNPKDFIALAKAKPGTLSYASAGVGSPLHLAAELFKIRTGIGMTHVPYKGGGPASVAVIAGEVQVLFGSLASSFPHVRAGRLKALAVTGPKRAALAPEIPTLAESGLPGFEVTSWYGLFVPARTPEQIVKTLHAEAVKALALPDVKEAIGRHGLEVAVKGPKELADQIKKETGMWAKVIETAGIKAE